MPQNSKKYFPPDCMIGYWDMEPEGGLFDGLNEEEIREVWKYQKQEKLPDGTEFYSLRNAVERFKLTKNRK